MILKALPETSADIDIGPNVRFSSDTITLAFFLYPVGVGHWY
jgi:hypothetical protein